MSLRALFRRWFPQHDYVPSLQTFQNLDVAKISEDLKLEEQGRVFGGQNLPRADSQDFDSVENNIVDCIEQARRQAEETATRRAKAYQNRLSASTVQGKFAATKVSTQQALADFTTEIRRAEDGLNRKIKEFRRRKTDLKDFKITHKLSRSADVDASRGFLGGLIVFLWAVESATNAVFLSDKHISGFVGAYSIAIGISLINIAAAFGSGRFSTNVFHRSILRKFGGMLCIVFAFAFLLGFNLLVAHYREATGDLLEQGGAEAIRRFQTAMFGLAEFESWILFGMGALFFFVAFLEGIFWDDRYPGYGRATRLVKNAEEEYADERENYIDDMQQICSDYSKAKSNEIKELNRRGPQRAQIVDNWQTLERDFQFHLQHLADAGNQLLRKYREANRTKRRDPVPPHFEQPWTIKPSNILNPAEIDAKREQDEVEQAGTMMADSVEEITQLYERHIDNIPSTPANLITRLSIKPQGG